MAAPRHLARIARLLYLLVAIFGGFALGLVYPKVYVAGDAARMTGNIIANVGLVVIARAIRPNTRAFCPFLSPFGACFTPKSRPCRLFHQVEMFW